MIKYLEPDKYMRMMDWNAIKAVAKGAPLPKTVTERIEWDLAEAKDVDPGAYRETCGQVTDAAHDCYCESMAAADFEERAYGRDD